MFTVHSVITNKPDVIKDFKKLDDARQYFYSLIKEHQELINRSSTCDYVGEGKEFKKLESDNVNIYLEKAK